MERLFLMFLDHTQCVNIILFLMEKTYRSQLTRFVGKFIKYNMNSFCIEKY